MSRREQQKSLRRIIRYTREQSDGGLCYECGQSHRLSRQFAFHELAERDVRRSLLRVHDRPSYLARCAGLWLCTIAVLCSLMSSFARCSLLMTTMDSLPQAQAMG
jgi:hypothetical protein